MLSAKTVKSISSQNATICSLFESLHNKKENQISMRFKSFKFDVNPIYESKKELDSIIFCHMN